MSTPSVRAASSLPAGSDSGSACIEGDGGVDTVYPVSPSTEIPPTAGAPEPSPDGTNDFPTVSPNDAPMKSGKFNGMTVSEGVACVPDSTTERSLQTPRSACKSKSPRSEKKADAGGSTSAPQRKQRKSKAGSHLRNFLAPTYKTRSVEFKRLFKLSDREKLVVDYSCAYQKEILLHGRMYLSQNWLCFYSNIFRWETTVKMCYKDIVNITKERTAKIIPNAIYITTNNNDRLFFTSFSARDKTFMMLFRLWQLALLDQVVKPVEMWSWARHGYEEADLYESTEENDDDDEGPVNDEGTRNGLEENRLPSRSNLAQKRGSDPNNVPLFSIGDGDKYAAQIEQAPASAGLEELSCKGGSRSSRLDGKCHSLNDVRSAVSVVAQPEQSDSSENDEEEVTCPCPTHEGRELLNSVYPLSVDQLFLWLFTDSEFFHQFQKLRRTKNLILSDWKIDNNTNAKLRQISYSVAVNHALAPKTCEVVEKQECMECSKAGHVYVIKVEVQNFGIPYSDAFQVMLCYCLTRTSSSQCRLRINSKVVYRKNCWGIVKSFIEKNALYNMLNHFADLGNLLRYECHRLGLTSSLPNGDSNASTVQDKMECMSVNQLALTSRQNVKPRTENAALETYARIIIILLLVLIGVCMVMLYCQWRDASTRMVECESRISKLLSRQLYSILLEEPCFFQTLPNGTMERRWMAKSFHEWNVRLESALRTVRAVESSIKAAVDTMNMAINFSQPIGAV